jgi:hypothetical protein
MRQAFISTGISTGISARIRVSIQISARQQKIHGHPRFAGPTKNSARNEGPKAARRQQVKSFRYREQATSTHYETATVVFIGFNEVSLQT